ncbi:hypothetical protein F5884DRAFT_417250 [Xylogone sp. PMI_703]|nr:hypothetical protein F5884DRAFT_417250 [Xylogone sp. PMI_703]
MWDKDMSFVSDRSHRLFELSESRHDPLFPEWQLCRYLPFGDYDYISGLTMYCQGHGITGIVAHGGLRQQIGLSSECPIHLSLQPKERIISVWIRVLLGIQSEFQPCILVTTNYSRSTIFGPYLEPALEQQLRYEWISLSGGSTSEITGIFYDFLPLFKSNRITNVGVTQQLKTIHNSETTSSPKVPLAYSRPRFYHCSTDAYFTVGSLRSIRKLKTRRVGPRITGMSISHYDGSIDILGMGDYSSNSSISEIYDEKRGPFMSITFVYCGLVRESYVKGIFISTDSAETSSFLQSPSREGPSCLIRNTVLMWRGGFHGFVMKSSLGKGCIEILTFPHINIR